MTGGPSKILIELTEKLDSQRKAKTRADNKVIKEQKKLNDAKEAGKLSPGQKKAFNAKINNAKETAKIIEQNHKKAEQAVRKQQNLEIRAANKKAQIEKDVRRAANVISSEEAEQIKKADPVSQTEQLNQKKEQSAIEKDLLNNKMKEVSLQTKLNKLGLIEDMDITKKVRAAQGAEQKELLNNLQHRQSLEKRLSRTFITNKKREAILAERDLANMEQKVEAEEKAGAVRQRSLRERTRFAMNFISIMMMGHQLATVLKRVAASGMNAFREISAGSEGASKGISILDANLKFVQFSLGAAISDYLLPWIDTIAMMAEWISDKFMENPAAVFAIIFGGIAVGTVAALAAQFIMFSMALRNLMDVNFSTIASGIGSVIKKMNKKMFAGGAGDIITRFAKGIGTGVAIYFAVEAGIKSFEMMKQGDAKHAIAYGLSSALGVAAAALMWVPGYGLKAAIPLMILSKAFQTVTDYSVKFQDENAAAKQILLWAGKTDEQIEAALQESSDKLNKGWKAVIFGHAIHGMRKPHSPFDIGNIYENISGDKIFTSHARLIEDNERFTKTAIENMANEYLRLGKEKESALQTGTDVNELNALNLEINKLSNEGITLFGDMWNVYLASLQEVQEEQKKVKDGLVDMTSGNIVDYTEDDAKLQAGQSRSTLTNFIDTQVFMGKGVSEIDTEVDKLIGVLEKVNTVQFDVSSPLKTAFDDVHNDAEYLQKVQDVGKGTSDTFTDGFKAGNVSFIGEVQSLADDVLRDKYNVALESINQSLVNQQSELSKTTEQMTSFAKATNSAAAAQERLNKAKGGKGITGVINSVKSFIGGKT